MSTTQEGTRTSRLVDVQFHIHDLLRGEVTWERVQYSKSRTNKSLYVVDPDYVQTGAGILDASHQRSFARLEEFVRLTGL